MSHRDYMVHVRMKPEMRQWLRERAWADRTTMTQFIVDLIHNEMKTEKASGSVAKLSPNASHAE